MSRLAATFERLRANGHPGLVTFVTAGDPSLPRSAEILAALDRAGIGEPTRSRLAQLDGITPWIVDGEVRRGSAKGTGALVRNIEAAVRREKSGRAKPKRPGESALDRIRREDQELQGRD